MFFALFENLTDWLIIGSVVPQSGMNSSFSLPISPMPLSSGFPKKNVERTFFAWLSTLKKQLEGADKLLHQPRNIV